MRPTLAILVALASAGCQQEYDHISLAGTDGILRFNLQFTNEAEVDLDLHVTTPEGAEIYYGSPEGSGGQLDIDCYCGEGNCANGPNENIYWDYDGEAAFGTYGISVQYYGACNDDIYATSDYTLRVLQAGDIVAEYLGTLGYLGEAQYTHVQGPEGQ